MSAQHFNTDEVDEFIALENPDWDQLAAAFTPGELAAWVENLTDSSPARTPEAGAMPQPKPGSQAQQSPKATPESDLTREAYEALSATTGFDYLNRVQPVTDADIAAMNAEIAAKAAAEQQRRATEQQATAEKAAAEGAAILAQQRQQAEQRQNAATAYLAGTDNSPAAAAAFIDQVAAESGSEAEYLQKLRAAGLVEGGISR